MPIILQQKCLSNFKKNKPLTPGGKTKRGTFKLGKAVCSQSDSHTYDEDEEELSPRPSDCKCDGTWCFWDRSGGVPGMQNTMAVMFGCSIPEHLAVKLGFAVFPGIV